MPFTPVSRALDGIAALGARWSHSVPNQGKSAIPEFSTIWTSIAARAIAENSAQALDRIHHEGGKVVIMLATRGPGGAGCVLASEHVQIPLEE